PSFTQPLMYKEIRAHRPVSAIYAERLEQEEVIEKGWVDGEVAAFTTLLEGEFEAAQSYLPNKADWFEGAWSGLGRPDEAITERRNVATGVGEALAREIGKILTDVPAEVAIHKTL